MIEKITRQPEDLCILIDCDGKYILGIALFSLFSGF